jgi:hypothetical protein
MIGYDEKAAFAYTLAVCPAALVVAVYTARTHLAPIGNSGFHW